MKPERPFLADPPERANQPPRPRELLGVLKYIPMDVSEQDQTAACGRADEPEGGIHGPFREVVRDPFPDEERASRRVKSRSQQGIFELLSVEVNGHEGDPFG